MARPFSKNAAVGDRVQRLVVGRYYLHTDNKGKQKLTLHKTIIPL
jgi:hypothetical protein